MGFLHRMARESKVISARLALLHWAVVFGLVLVAPGGGIALAQKAKAGGGRPLTGRSPTGGSADVKSLLDQGIYSFEEGDMDSAHAAFERAFAMNPTDDALSEFVDRATVAKVYGMVASKDRRLAGFARQILESSTRIRKPRMADSEAVTQAVQEVLTSEGQERYVKRVLHANSFGRNLVPALIPVLADNDLSRRETAINWIAGEIELDAVPVLQAARKHPNPTVRRNVADLLGVRDLRHRVSLATLQAMVETDPAADVQRTAAKSLGLILTWLGEENKKLSAKEYFLNNGIQYYLHPHKNPFARTYYTPTVYRLEGENVVGEEVADFQLSERMAEQALEEALELDANFGEAQTLTLCNDAMQVHEYDLNVAFYAKNESSGNGKEILEKQKPWFDYVRRNRVRIWPEQVLYEGLDRALEDGRSEVALKIIETIHETERNGRVPEPLVRALEDTSSRLVRIAAATTLAFWNPTAKEFDAGEQVVSILSEAVLTSGVRTVHKVFGNAQLANRFEEMLRDLNMEGSSSHDSVERAVAAAISSPPDVVLIDEGAKKSSGRQEVAPINQFVNELRKNYRSANVPVIVVVPGASLDKAKSLYESEERKVWVVPDSIDSQALNNAVFNKLFQDKDDSKAQATRLARVAAEAVQHVTSIPAPRIPIQKSAESLRRVLKNRPDEVRIPCIRALGNLRAVEAAGELAAVFASTENAKAVRAEAMKALGKVLQADSSGAQSAIRGIIEEGMKEQDLDLRAVSWFAYSNSGADPKDRLTMLTSAPPAAAATPPAEAAEAGSTPAAKKEAAEEPGGDTEPPAPEEKAPPAENPDQPERSGEKADADADKPAEEPEK